MDAGKLINKMIKDSGMTYAELSRALGKTDRYITATLGRGSCPRLDTFVDIAHALGYKVQIIDKIDRVTEIKPTKIK